eukprot:2485252-Pyramimonas_sp.AAC.1
MTTPRFDEALLAELELRLPGAFHECEEGGWTVVYGDGSGGKHSDDPRRRRCGAAIVALAPDEQGQFQERAGIA